jgi:glycosyltransferase involved in cell wall biosynthesis
MNLLHIGKIQIRSDIRDSKENLEPIPGLGHDGPSRNIIGFCRGLAQCGHSVSLLLSDPIPEQSIAILSDVKVLPYWKEKAKLPGNVVSYVCSHAGRPDLVIFHDYYYYEHVSFARSFLAEHIPYVIIPRGGLCAFAQRRKPIKKFIANILFFNRYLTHARFVIALTKNEALEIQRFNSRLKLLISSNGISESVVSFNFAGVKLVNEESTDIPLVVGFLGQLDVPIKGIDLLLRAISIFQRNQKEKRLRFVFVGRPKTLHDKATMDSLIALLPEPALCAIAGPKYNKEKWLILNSFDIFVHTSRTEGMPTAVIEAMAIGKPCLVTPGTNMTNAIESSGGGWVAEQNVMSIAQKLTEISRLTRREIQEIGARNIRFVKENYLWEKVAQRFIESYSKAT